MRDPNFVYTANISIMFAERSFLERPRAAAAAGFQHIEMWWPFPTATADTHAVEQLLRAIADAEVRLTCLNFFAGDMPSGERGIANRPDRRSELQANTDQLVTIAERTGCQLFNLLFGQRDERWSPAEQDEAAVRAIREAAADVRELGGTVLLEPLAVDLNGGYRLSTTQQVIDLLAGKLADVPNLALLFDVFHLGSNGADIVRLARDVLPWIGHVQLADSPGRGEPGSGNLPIAESVAALAAEGYRGLIGCEYKPTTRTEDSFGWIERTA